MLKISKNAVFVADAHVVSYGGEFKALEAMENRQIFFMGDVFHLLIGILKSSVAKNAELLAVIEKIAQKNKVYFLEGNHDFALKYIADLMPSVRIITRSEQPIICKLESATDSIESALDSTQNQKSQLKSPTESNTQKELTITIAHGDIFINRAFHAYIAALTFPPTLWAMRLLDNLTFGKIYHFAHEKVAKKTLRIWQGDASKFAAKRIEAYKKAQICADIIIEGHFHIGAVFKFENAIYAALPAFYAKKSPIFLESILKTQNFTRI